MRKIFKKIHLWLSVPVGLILSIICLTGAILVFEKEITEKANSHLYKVEYKEGMIPMTPSQLVAHINQQMGNGNTLEISSLQIAGQPDKAWTAKIKNDSKKTLSINPYTGEINGWIEGSAFFQNVRKLHRWLLDPPLQKGAKSVGKVIVGVSTLLMGIILISGIVIWIPRNRKALKNRLQIACTKGWRRFWYDTHVSLGFYAAIFLLIMVLTGLTWSFQWYRTGFYALFGASTEQPKRVDVQYGDKEGKKKEHKECINYVVWDKVVAELQNQYSGFDKIVINEKEVQITQSGERRQDTAFFNSRTGEIKDIKVHKTDDVPAWANMKKFIYSLHTGLWGGMVTRIIYFIAAFVGGVLPLTGYYLWIKRTFRKKKQNNLI